MLALNRQIIKGHSRVQQGNYSLSGLVGFDMHGKTVGVVGTGKIGRCTAAILLGMGRGPSLYSLTPVCSHTPHVRHVRVAAASPRVFRLGGSVRLFTPKIKPP